MVRKAAVNSSVWALGTHLKNKSRPKLTKKCPKWTFQTLHAAAKLPKVRLCESHVPGACFSSDAAPADDWGLRTRVFSRKFCEGAGKSQIAFWREWPSKPCIKNCLISNNLAACLQGCKEVLRDNSMWFGRWWTNLYRRNYCSTWVLLRKINMQFAKEPRKYIVYSRRMTSPG